MTPTVEKFAVLFFFSLMPYRTNVSMHFATEIVF